MSMTPYGFNMTIWENRIQDAKVWMYLSYIIRMFYILCSVFFPSIEPVLIFLLFCVFLYMTVDAEYFFTKLSMTFFRMTHTLQWYLWALFVQRTAFCKCTYHLPALHDQQMTQVIAAWHPASSTDITANIWAHVPTQRLYFHTFRNMISVPL